MISSQRPSTSLWEIILNNTQINNLIKSKKERKDWVITGTSTVQYEFDTEGVLTAQELKDKREGK